MSMADSAIKTQYAKWTKGLSRLHTPRAVRRLVALFSSTRWTPMLVLFTLNAVVLSFVDPGVSWSAETARLFVSMVCGMLGTFVPCLISMRIARRRWGIRGKLRAAPIGILVGLAGVVVSRIIGFIPGLLSGSTVRFLQSGDKTKHADVQVLQSCITLAISGLSWLGASVVPGHGNALVMLVHDALISTCIITIVGTALDMIPLGFLSGGVLFAERRRAWLLLTVVSTVAFCVVVLPQPSFWINVGDDVGWWMTVAAVASVAAVAVIVLMQRHQGRQRQQPTAATQVAG